MGANPETVAPKQKIQVVGTDEAGSYPSTDFHYIKVIEKKSKPRSESRLSPSEFAYSN